MSISAMKLALEALELALRSHGVMLLSDPPQEAWKTYGVEVNARQAITALRTALDQAEKQEPVTFVCSTGLCRFTLTQTNVGIGERGMQAYEEAKKRGWVGISDEGEKPAG